MGSPGRITERRSLAAAALALLVAAACHADGGSTTSEPGPFTRADVDAIVLGPNDALEGTAYVDGISGFQDLKAFARDQDEDSSTSRRTASRSDTWPVLPERSRER